MAAERLTNLDVHCAALEYLKAGLSVIPVRLDGTKAPALPRGNEVLLRKRRATQDELRQWFLLDDHGIGVLCGPVSGGAECIDFDDPALIGPWLDLVLPELPGISDRICVVKTPAGWHVWYKSPACGPNKVLAQAEDGGTLIETRGEGGYAVAPGSPRAVHELRLQYRHDDGPPLTGLATLDPEERRVLIDAAASMTRKPAVPTSEPDPPPAGRAPPGLSPGDDYTRRGPDWGQILEPHGWKCVGSSGEVRYWQRPAKPGEKKKGKSATTGHCKGADGADLFYPFTANAEPFVTGKGYSKFRAYAALNHAGDLSAAAKALRAEGYGDGAPPATADRSPAGERRPTPPKAAHPATVTGSAASGPAPPPQPREGEEAFTAEELMRMILPPPRWAVPELVAEGMTILAGRPKTGKSWLALHVAMTIAAGGAVLDRYPVERGGVLYLALEDTRRRLQKRVGLLLAGRKLDLRGLHLRTRWRPLAEGGADDLDAWIGERRPRLVIIDTMAKLRPRARPNENAYAADYEYVATLKAFADRHAVAVIGVHHTSKTPRADPVDEVSGTLGLTGGADNILVLKREREKKEASLFFTGRDLDEGELAVTADVANNVWRSEGDAAERRDRADRAEVLDLLRDQPEGLKPSEVAELLGRPRGNVRVLLHRLAKEGAVRVYGHKYFVA